MVIGDQILIPNAFKKNGWGIFERPVDGDKRQVGIFQDDAIRNITGTFPKNAQGDAFYSGVFSIIENGIFDASKIVPTAAENRPKHRYDTGYLFGCLSIKIY